MPGARIDRARVRSPPTGSRPRGCSTTIVWTPCVRRSWAAALIVVASSRKLTSRMPFALTISGVPSSVRPMKPTLTPPTLLDRGGRQDRLAGVLVDDVGGQEWEVGARVRVAGVAAVDRVAAAVLDAEQLVDAFVELVVADGRNVEADEIQGFDRRLVMERGRDQGRPADVVAGGDHQCPVRVGRLEVLDVVRQVPKAAGEDAGGWRRSTCVIVCGGADPTARAARRLQVAMEVVDRQQLDVDGLGRLRRLGGRYRGRHDERQRDEHGGDRHPTPRGARGGAWTDARAGSLLLSRKWGSGCALDRLA